VSESGAPFAMPNPTQPSPRIQRDAQAMMRYDANKKSVGVAYALWFFFGSLGAHRFYLKQTGTAVAMLIITLISIPFTFVGIGFIGLGVVWIWVIVDAFLIPGIARAYNNQLINNLTM
jgi:TM2 domain-containing membrane protein YozV